MDAEKLKSVARTTVDCHKTELHQLSEYLWENPELGFEEHKAHDFLCDFLEKYGFEVERHYLLDTAFRATYRKGTGPHVAVLCEYDALPEIGHACGHNLIAEAGAGAGLAIKAAMTAAEENIGTLSVIGTPGEEGYYGKIKMLERGAFRDLDCAMMVHPNGVNTKARAAALNSMYITATYTGKPSHACVVPWDGVNALDAVMLGYNAISCMRQQLKPTWRVSGMITDGGTSTGTIAEHTSMKYIIRTPTKGEMTVLREKTHACLQAAAIATGCEVDLQWAAGYENVISSEILVGLYEKNAAALNMELHDNKGGGASTDFGNVSHVIPGLHPLFALGTRVENHSRGFTDVTGGTDAQPRTFDQAKLLAMIAIDVLCNPQLVPKMKQNLQDDLEKGL